MNVGTQKMYKYHLIKYMFTEKVICALCCSRPSKRARVWFQRIYKLLGKKKDQHPL